MKWKTKLVTESEIGRYDGMVEPQGSGARWVVYRWESGRSSNREEIAYGRVINSNPTTALEGAQACAEGVIAALQAADARQTVAVGSGSASLPAGNYVIGYPEKTTSG